MTDRSRVMRKILFPRGRIMISKRILEAVSVAVPIGMRKAVMFLKIRIMSRLRIISVMRKRNEGNKQKIVPCKDKDRGKDKCRVKSKDKSRVKNRDNRREGSC